ncbi:hypothetical protein Tco_0699654 [Tanacetum coccineum]
MTPNPSSYDLNQMPSSESPPIETQGHSFGSMEDVPSRTVQYLRMPCYYANFMKCQPLNFKGTKDKNLGSRHKKENAYELGKRTQEENDGQGRGEEEGMPEGRIWQGEEGVLDNIIRGIAPCSNQVTAFPPRKMCPVHPKCTSATQGMALCLAESGRVTSKYKAVDLQLATQERHCGRQSLHQRRMDVLSSGSRSKGIIKRDCHRVENNKGS